MATATFFRVVLADDHPVTRLGLRGMISAMPGLIIAGEAQTGDEALEHCRTLLPHVAVLDFWLPGLNALQVLERLNAENCPVRVLVLSGQGTLETARQAHRAGAFGFISKDTSAAELTRSVFEVAAGRSVWTGVQKRSFEALDQRPALSPRELEVLRALSTGASNKEIAQALGLSDGTVRIHVSNIFGKLDVDDRTTAVTLALKQGLITLQ